MAQTHMFTYVDNINKLVGFSLVNKGNLEFVIMPNIKKNLIYGTKLIYNLQGEKVSLDLINKISGKNFVPAPKLSYLFSKCKVNNVINKSFCKWYGDKVNNVLVYVSFNNYSNVITSFISFNGGCGEWNTTTFPLLPSDEFGKSDKEIISYFVRRHLENEGKRFEGLELLEDNAEMLSFDLFNLDNVSKSFVNGECIEVVEEAVNMLISIPEDVVDEEREKMESMVEEFEKIKSV